MTEKSTIILNLVREAIFILPSQDNLHLITDNSLRPKKYEEYMAH